MMTQDLIKDCTDCDSDCVSATLCWGTQDNIAIISAIQIVIIIIITVIIYKWGLF